jgi:hypothetical protein
MHSALIVSVTYGVPLGPARFCAVVLRAKSRKHDTLTRKHDVVRRKHDKRSRKHDAKNIAFSRYEYHGFAYSPSISNRVFVFSPSRSVGRKCKNMRLKAQKRDIFGIVFSRSHIVFSCFRPLNRAGESAN